ncbi:Doublecortin-domain-containing echinoderm-microtubule-associated protein [Carabus blaptoides fortunei]
MNGGVSSNTLAVSGNGTSAERPADSDDDYDAEIGSPVRNLVANGGGGYWRSTAASRPTSPGAAMADNASETSSMMPAQPVVGSRPKSRADGATSRYSNLSYWRARKVVFYKNCDPFFPRVEFRFKPGRDIGSLESLLDKLSLRMDLPRGARYIFSMDGDRKLRLDELEDGASYVVYSYKAFKVRKVSIFGSNQRVPVEFVGVNWEIVSILPIFYRTSLRPIRFTGACGDFMCTRGVIPCCEQTRR